MSLIDHTPAPAPGVEYHRWTLVREVGGLTDHGPCWLVRCRCGVEKVLPLYRVRSGYSKSCGCSRRKVGPGPAKTYDRHKVRVRLPDTRSPREVLRATWTGMIRRCHTPTDGTYWRYGGRGITVCDRWRQSFELFAADMGERPVGTSIDRIDNSRGYEPGNCRWATREEQRRNQGRSHLVEFRGRVQPIAAWAAAAALSLAPAMTTAPAGQAVIRKS